MSIISTKLSVSNISNICCRDDADTAIVKESLQYSLLGNVGVVPEEADILIILIHHFDDINIHKEIRILTSEGHYSGNEIVNNLTPDEKLWILLCHSFSGCDTVSWIFGVSKETFYQKICSGQLRQIIEKFYCDTTSIEDTNAEILIFQFIYNMPATSLSIQHLCRYNKQAKGGVIWPASLPPTNGSVIQHSQGISTNIGSDTFKLCPEIQDCMGGMWQVLDNLNQ